MDRVTNIRMGFAGFLALLLSGQMSAQQYKFSDLHTISQVANSYATDINDSGVVVGYVTGGSLQQAFIWTNGSMQLIPLPGGRTTSWAFGINNSGTICGVAGTPFRLVGTTYSFLNLPTSSFSSPSLGNINAAGDIVGYAEYPEVHATLWQGTAYHDLGILGGVTGQRTSSATYINDRGVIVGQSTTSTGQWHAFRYSGSTMQDLGTLPGNTITAALGIDNRNRIVGWSGYPVQPVFWDSVGVIHQLALPSGALNGQAMAINDTGDIVGYYYPPTGDRVACLWKNGVPVDLNSLVTLPAGYQLAYAAAINNSGQIVGTARTAGVVHPFMLTPVSVRVTSPASNELVLADGSYDIQWRSVGMDSVKLEFSLDSGATYQPIVRSTPAAWGRYSWTVPDTFSAKCKIRITNLTTSSSDNPMQTTSESQTFKLKGYVLTRFKPNGDYEAFDPAIHGWRFPNDSVSMWPESWWRQFDYQNGVDPATQERYREYLEHLHLSAQSSQFVDWPLFVRSFGGIGRCYQGSHTLSIAALRLWIQYSGKWGGSCWGFPVSALMAFDNKAEFQQAFPEIGSFNNLYDLTLNNERRSLVNMMYQRQGGLEHMQTEKNINKEPRTALQDIKRMLLAEQRQDAAVSVKFRKGEGHGVAPYKLKRVNGSLFRLLVYDCNDPGDRRPYIEIDSLNNTWKFPAYEPTIFNSGIWLDDSVQTYYRLAALHPYFLTLSSNPTRVAAPSSDICFYNTAGSSILISDSAGHSMGFSDSSEFGGIPRGVSMTPISGYRHYQPPYGSYLPPGRYSIAMGSSGDSIVNFTAAFNNYLLSFWRSGADHGQVDRFSFLNGLNVGNPDPQSKRINLEAMVLVDTSDREFQILNCLAVHSDSLKIMMLDSSWLKFVNLGPQKTYDLQIGQVGANTSAWFLHASITVPANSSHYIVPNWQDLQHQSVRIYQDLGNIGTIHDTLIVDNQATDVQGQSTPATPREFTLEQNYPNPFNPSTTIRYALPQTSHVTLTVYNTPGQQVSQLVNEQQAAGYHDVVFNGEGLASGVYFYRLQAGDNVATKKLLLLR